MLRVLLNKLTSPQIRTIKRDLKLVRSAITLELPRDIHSFGDKHIVRLEDNVTVKPDGSKGIQPLKGQHGLGPLRDMRGGKDGAVGPRALADPLHVELILADERVGNDLVVDKVEVDVGGELGDGEVGGLRVVHLLEVPALVERRHGATGHLAGCGAGVGLRGLGRV